MLRQYGVYRIRSAPPVDLCVVLNGGLYLELDPVLIMPISPVSAFRSSLPIHAEIRVRGEKYRLRPDLMASAPRTFILDHVGDLADQYVTLQNSLDRLLSGY